MGLYNIYIFTVLFSLLQFTISTIKTISREKTPKNKTNIDEEFEKAIEEMKLHSKIIANIIYSVLTKELLYRILLFILCFIPIVNIIVAFVEICEIFNI